MTTDGHLNRLACLTAQEVDLAVQTAKCYQFATICVHGCRVAGLFSAASQAVLVGISLLLHYRIIVLLLSVCVYDVVVCLWYWLESVKVSEDEL